jgi:hypothetical protein
MATAAGATVEVVEPTNDLRELDERTYDTMPARSCRGDLVLAAV